MADETPNPQNQQTQGRAAGTNVPEESGEPNADGQQDDSGGTNVPDDPVDQTDDVQALRHEAASRRRALRAVEAERDQLRERIDAQDRAEVERIVAGSLADPSDLWSAVDLDALREDGAITEEKVSEALAGLLERKPHYALDRPRVNLHQGARQEVAEPPSFGQALKSGGRR